MRVSIYSRISTDKQDAENQLAQLRAYCANQGWTIVHEYVDVASGGRSDREQFNAMFKAASKRSFDLLLFWALDRVTREGALATLQYLERLSAYGVAYKSYTEQYLDSLGPFKEAVLAIISCVARAEKARISERTKAGLARARAKGSVIGRPRVTGEQDKARIAELRANRNSFAQIATMLGISESSARRCGA